MGLFGRSETIVDVPTNDINVPEDISNVVPDVGEYFLGLMPEGEPQVLAAAQIGELRHANGAVPGRLRGIDYMKYKQGPVCLLSNVRERVALEVWATYGLSGRQKRDVVNGVVEVWLEQGVAAAATWAIIARPDHRFDIWILTQQLHSAHAEDHDHLTNRDVVKAFRKWQR